VLAAVDGAGILHSRPRWKGATSIVDGAGVSLAERPDALGAASDSEIAKAVIAIEATSDAIDREWRKTCHERTL